jgi:hypothetical protein
MKKLMELQKQAVERGQIQIEHEKRSKKRSTSFFSGLRNRSNSGDNSNSKIRIVLRGGKGNKSKTISGGGGGGNRKRPSFLQKKSITGDVSALINNNNDNDDGGDDDDNDDDERNRSMTPTIVDSVAVESAREKLLLGTITKEEFLNVIAADAAKVAVEEEVGTTNHVTSGKKEEVSDWL